eukprot:m.290262 g.290262  ORF g.290262 m.290262 type:complete len:535 (+) comp19464_c0_seq12:84-1688(+)
MSLLRRRVERPGGSRKRRQAGSGDSSKASADGGGDDSRLEEAVFGYQGRNDLADVLGAEAALAVQQRGKDNDSDSEDGDDTKMLNALEDEDGDEADESGEDGDSDGGNDHRDTLRQSKRRKPAWVDHDDTKLDVDISSVARLRKLRTTEDETFVAGDNYQSRLRSQFAKVHGQAAWANLDQQADEGNEYDPGSQLLRRAGPLLAGSAQHRRLPQASLDVTRQRDANYSVPSEAVVQATEFHPAAPVLFTAGLDKTLRIFQIDGTDNPCLQKTFLPDLPIYSAQFASQGREIIMSGRRKFFYSYDIEQGRVRKIHQIQGHTEKSLEYMRVSPDGKLLAFVGHDGTIIVLSNKTKQWVADLKMNGSVRQLAFSADSSRLFSSGDDGTVYVWDLGARECVHTFVDEGCVRSTSLAVAGNGTRFACGSDAGIVNIYDESCLTEHNPTPIKVIKNLTTAVDTLVFNPDSQILAAASRFKKQATKMVHVGSNTVFGNWPTAASPLSYVQTVAFSPGSGYVTVGNDKGKALLYRLNHYNAV